MKLSLYYPVKPMHVNNPFGTPDPKYTGLGLVGHNGLDFAAVHGQPIYASHDGVAYYEIDENSGHGVIIVTNNQFDYPTGPAYFKTIYWHLCDSSKEPGFRSPLEDLPSGVGRQVKAGDLIGYADNTGLSTGDHLHFGLKPMKVGEPPTTFYNIEQNNGYGGAIDPTPYLNGLFAQDILGSKYSFSKNLGLYSMGYDVFQLQKLLVQGGFGNFTPTGFYGSKTQAAVKAYQVIHNIEPTGYFGPLTRASMNV